MNKKVKKVELVLRKINYLFDSIESNPLQSSNLEMALLKRYAIDLYDTILEFEAVEGWDVNGNPQLAGEIETSNELEESLQEVPEEIENNFEEEVSEEETELAEEVGNNNIEKTVTSDLTSILESVNQQDNKEETIDIIAEATPNVNLEEAQEEITIDFEDLTDNDETQVLTHLLEQEEEELVEEEPEPEVFPVYDLEDIPENATEPISNNAFDENKTVVLEDVYENLNGKQEGVLEESVVKTDNGLNKTLQYQSEQQNETLNDRLKNNQLKKFNISYNQRFSFISELFGNEEEVYENTLHELGKCNNVIEAFTYLNLHIKLKYKWRDDSSTTKEFQQIIKDKFLND